MRALVIHSAQDLRLENREQPAMGEHELLVSVAFGGICGSDLHYYQHGGFGTVRIKQPMALATRSLVWCRPWARRSAALQKASASPYRLQGLAATAVFARPACKTIA